MFDSGSFSNATFADSLGASPGGGGGEPGGLSDDTSLSAFVIAGQTPTLVSPGVYAVDLDNSRFENSVLDILDILTITPTNPAATVSDFALDPDPTVEGNNAFTFIVTAEDGVTVQNYTLTIHVLTAGVAEIYRVTCSGTGTSVWTGGGSISYDTGVITAAGGNPAFYTESGGGLGYSFIEYTANSIGDREDAVITGGTGDIGILTVTTQGADPS